MSELQLGRLEEVDPREVWRDEARDFTPWLAENLSVLSEAVGLPLELVGQEEQVGDFTADIVASVDDVPVVIENQLARTDHLHLGQLLTYAAGKDARILIWVTPELREEHQAALEWINRYTQDEIDVFGVEVRAVKIGESRLAPEFRVVVAPNYWQRRQRRKRPQSSTAPTRSANWGGQFTSEYSSFFSPIVAVLAERGLTQKSRNAYGRHYASAFGLDGMSYGTVFLGREGGIGCVQVYFSSKQEERNKQLFDLLAESKNEIEEELGTELSWERWERNPWCALRMTRPAAITDPPEMLEEVAQWMIKQMPRFVEVVEPRLREIAEQLEAKEADGV